MSDSMFLNVYDDVQRKRVLVNVADIVCISSGWTHHGKQFDGALIEIRDLEPLFAGQTFDAVLKKLDEKGLVA